MFLNDFDVGRADYSLQEAEDGLSLGEKFFVFIFVEFLFHDFLVDVAHSSFNFGHADSNFEVVDICFAEHCRIQ